MSSRKSHSQAIGMFDSGVGGLTVMQQIMRVLPQESIVYFGDTARVPYGGKSGKTIVRYSIEGTIFLMEQDIKLLVIACNTVCAYALDKLNQIFNIPIVGVIEPGAERAVQVSRNGHIAVLGTKATINSGSYQKEITRLLPSAQITAIPCPLFVPLVEEHFVSHPAARLIIKEYLAPLRKQKVDTVLLGCTHYPLLRKLIEEEVGEGVSIVDSALTCAEKVSSLLDDLKLHGKHGSPKHRYYVSDDPEKVRVLGREFLGMPLDDVELASSIHNG